MASVNLTSFFPPSLTSICLLVNMRTVSFLQPIGSFVRKAAKGGWGEFCHQENISGLKHPKSTCQLVKEVAHPNQEYACFVLYLKLINTFFFKYCIYPNCPRNSKIALKFYVGQVVLEILIKTII